MNTLTGAIKIIDGNRTIRINIMRYLLIITHTALISVLTVSLSVAVAAPAGLGPRLQQIADMQKRVSDNAAIQLAKRNTFAVRSINNEELIPVIIDRDAAGSLLKQRKLILDALGIKVDVVSPSYIRLLVLPRALRQLEQVLSSISLRAPIPLKTSEGFGSIISQSATLTNAANYHNANSNGSGVKIAVVDLGFGRLQDTINNGELPGSLTAVRGNALTTISDIQNTGQTHGTNVAQHVMDMAPGAELHCILITDEVDLENAAVYMRNQGIDIANLSVEWVLASYYDDTGSINQIINNSHDNDGVFWSVAAGNEAQRHWRGTWVDTDGDNYLDFTAGNDAMEILASSQKKSGDTISIYLNWDQYSSSSRTDFDLYVFDNAGVSDLDMKSVLNQSTSGPYEAVSFAYDPLRAPYTIRIQYVRRSNSGVDLTIFSFTDNLEYAIPASSLMDPASAHGAFTVGAVAHGSWNNANPALRSYSARGPTTDGRQGLDIVAPDGTDYLGYISSSQSYGTLSAFGTSFAAPTIAGAAALLLSEDSSLTVSQLASLLSSNAIDAGALGPDTNYGAGRISVPLIDADSDGIRDGGDNCPIDPNPSQSDVDGDLLGDVCDPDADNDGLLNIDEVIWGSDPLVSDTDTDGLTDGQEVNAYNTNPVNPDTDSDGVTDGDEVNVYGIDPNVSNLGDLGPRGAPNGQVNSGDLVVLMRLVLGSIQPTTLEQILADINTDGMLDVADILLLQQAILNGTAP